MHTYIDTYITTLCIYLEAFNYLFTSSTIICNAIFLDKNIFNLFNHFFLKTNNLNNTDENHQSLAVEQIFSPFELILYGIFVQS
jgi:hypothetical protein